MDDFAQRREGARRYIGVGIDRYIDQDEYPPLKRAFADVLEVGSILEAAGFDVCLFRDPGDEIEGELEAILPVEGYGSEDTLVIVWAGHGRQAKHGGLKLPSAETTSRKSPRLSAADLAEMAVNSGAGQILLVLDTCESGGGVTPAIAVADSELLEARGGVLKSWFGVIASALDWEPALDGAFGSLLLKLLKDGPSHPRSRDRWEHEGPLIRGDHLADALQKDWNQALHQAPKWIPIGNPQPILPNPLFKARRAGHIDPQLLAAAWGGGDRDEDCCFCGRVAQINQIVARLRQGKPGIVVVTGPAGSGKSAILGRLLALMHPQEREKVLASCPPEHADPGEKPDRAQVLARRHNADSLLESLERQLVRAGVIEKLAGGLRRGRGELQQAIEQSGKTPLIVIDGLNEAGPEAWRIAEDPVRMLATRCLVLIGTRDLPPADGPITLLQTIGAEVEIDLGAEITRESTETDVRRYIGKRLGPAAGSADVVDKLMELVCDHAGHRAGAFLLANLLTRQQSRDPVALDTPDWKLALIKRIAESRRDFATGIEPWPRDGGEPLHQAPGELLSALDWAKGAGFPDDVWVRVASALSDTGVRYEPSDIYDLADRAAETLITDSQGTRAVYRLAGQSLIDLLGIGSDAGSLQQAAAQSAARVAEALVGYYEELLEVGHPPRRRAYLWRFTWRHCADAGETGIAAFRRLVEQDPEAFRPQLARALSTRSKGELRLGNWAAAHRAAAEAAQIYAALAEHDDALLVDLNAARVNLARISGLLGNPDEARETAARAIESLSAMDDANPLVPGLQASARCAYCNALGQAGEWDAAIKEAEDAVLLLELLHRNSDAYKAGLAEALASLAFAYGAAGVNRKAHDTAESAEALYRTMDTADPPTGLMFASCLVALAWSRAGNGQLITGRDAASEAETLLKRLGAIGPIADMLRAWALTARGQIEIQLGDHEAARAALCEALELLAAPADGIPTARGLLALARVLLAQSSLQAGSPPDALRQCTEAIALVDQRGDGGSFLDQIRALGSTISAQTLMQLSRAQESVDTAEEAIRLIGRIEERHGRNRMSATQLAQTLAVAAAGRIQLGRVHEGSVAAGEALRILSAIEQTTPAEDAVKAQALMVIAQTSLNPQDSASAVSAADEAARLFGAGKARVDIANPGWDFLRALALVIAALGRLMRLPLMEGKDVELLLGQSIENANEAAGLLADVRESSAFPAPIANRTLAFALSTLGRSRLLAGQTEAALRDIERAVDLMMFDEASDTKTVDAQTVGVFADALQARAVALGAGGASPDAVDAALDAVLVIQCLARANQSLSMLVGYAAALAILCGYHRQAGDEARIDDIWNAAVAQASPRVGAFLLIRRSQNRVANEIAAMASDLIEAEARLEPEDNEMHALLHAVGRDRRAIDADAFDAAWTHQSGRDLPRWLTLDLSTLQTVLTWVRQPTYAAEKAFLADSIDALDLQSALDALDELTLDGLNPAGHRRYRATLETALGEGLDAAYAPLENEILLQTWLDGDIARRRELLAAELDRLIGPGVAEILRSRLDQAPDDPILLAADGSLKLLRDGHDALVLDLFEHTEQPPALLSERIRDLSVEQLDGLSKLVCTMEMGAPLCARVLFHHAVALATAHRPEAALSVLGDARRRDPTQIGDWMQRLFALAAQSQHELSPLVQALIAPEPSNAQQAES